MTKKITFETTREIEALVQRTCSHMNNESWREYLSECDNPHFRYRVVNYSPEIRREQCWADRTYSEMATSFSLLPKHNTDHSKLIRHATPKRIQFDDDKNKYVVDSDLVIYKTQLDGTNSHRESGKTELYAVGYYKDVIGEDENGNMRLLSRTVTLETRQLDIGTHKPF